MENHDGDGNDVGNGVETGHSRSTEAVLGRETLVRRPVLLESIVLEEGSISVCELTRGRGGPHLGRLVLRHVGLLCLGLGVAIGRLM